ncbi:MBL fold metallo-hydrolase [Spectribacter hydrogenoxidans]|uniref:MBL fold metallo-hydrolase n=1 Tax=Spectribacter hydrogenoxidans TaxID=3075608 RepID=A0ABU3BX95_9GAMM|nr:MBL fold metallo-hydrolase [Salinisphaera sp. W335]MDT0633756.1 MBL fold metallo-hydrolase [Salinisphaera sp. W335]
MQQLSTNAWQIGRVKITRIMELGDVPFPAEVLFTNYDPADLAAQDWMRPHYLGEDNNPILSVHTFVVETPDRLILVDTCTGNDKPRVTELFDHLQTGYLDDLAAVGAPPERVDTVLCTHLHLDHVGWNTRLEGDRWVPTFPNAEYLFGRVEWEHWEANKDIEIVEGATGEANPIVNASAVIHDSILPVVDAGLHRLVETDHRICDELRLEATPGHTPGHVSVHIESDGDHAIISGDMLHSPYQMARPGVGVVFDSDGERAAATRRDFFGRYADRPILLLGTHFATPVAGHIVSHGDSWRFEPWGNL